MNRYFVSRHVHVCQLDDGVIFLDLKTQRYLGLENAQADLLCAVVNSWPSRRRTDTAEDDIQGSSTLYADAEATADALANREILTTDRVQGKSAAPVCLAMSDAVPFEGRDGTDTITVRNILDFAVACTVAAFNLKYRSLQRLVGALEKRKRSQLHAQPIPDRGEIARLVRVFRRLRPFLFTARGACLFDSLALVGFLRRYRISATLVFGVSNKPFGAHSWAQCGDLVLNDTLESVKHHVPILTI